MNAWTLRCLVAGACQLVSLSAQASPPEPAPTPISIEPAPVLPAEPASGEALRIVEGPVLPAPAPEPPAPALIVEPTPLACTSITPRVIPKRPPVGTGLLVAGAAGLGLASLMVVVATVGRNESGLTSKQSIPVGLTALPVAAIGIGAMFSGMKANQKYTRWVADNGLDAPASGNGLLVAGTVLSAVGAVSMGFAIDHNRRVNSSDIGDRLLTGLTGTLLAGGVMLVGGGVIQRSRFSAWEGIGYVRPGVYAGRGGAGLTLSGRF